MNARQFRMCRAALNLSTRELAQAVGCSHTAVWKSENEPGRYSRTSSKVQKLYEDFGLVGYCGGVISVVDPTIAAYANQLRERLLDDSTGSAYVLAFDRIVALATAEASRIEDEELKIINGNNSTTQKGDDR